MDSREQDMFDVDCLEGEPFPEPRFDYESNYSYQI